MAISIRDEGAKVNSDINVTPMVDVMLVLLIIFMVITPMLQKGAAVDMAKVNNPQPCRTPTRKMRSSSQSPRNGDVFFGNDRIQPDQLTNKIKDRIANKVNKTVYLRADARAKIQIRRRRRGQRSRRWCGRLGLLTDQKKQTGTPGSPTHLPPAPAGLNRFQGASYGNVTGWWKGWAER